MLSTTEVIVNVIADTGPLTAMVCGLFVVVRSYLKDLTVEVDQVDEKLDKLIAKRRSVKKFRM